MGKPFKRSDNYRLYYRYITSPVEYLCRILPFCHTHTLLFPLNGKCRFIFVLKTPQCHSLRLHRAKPAAAWKNHLTRLEHITVFSLQSLPINHFINYFSKFKNICWNYDICPISLCLSWGRAKISSIFFVTLKSLRLCKVHQADNRYKKNCVSPAVWKGISMRKSKRLFLLTTCPLISFFASYVSLSLSRSSNIIFIIFYSVETFAISVYDGNFTLIRARSNSFMLISHG